jgi:hypothetical protein
MTGTGYLPAAFGALRGVRLAVRFAVVRLAVVVLAAALRVVDFFVAAFLVAAFLTGARLAVALPVVVFFAAFATGVFLAVARFVGAFLAAFFPVVFVPVVFVPVVFVPVVFVAVVFSAVALLAGDFVAAVPAAVVRRLAAVLPTVARAVLLTAEALVEEALRAAEPDAARGVAGNRFFPVTTSLKPWPARKAGAEDLRTLTGSPVRGFRAVRAPRSRFSNTPNPAMDTFSPLATAR